eukprot:195244_1
MSYRYGKRIQKEIRDFVKDPDQSMVCIPDENNNRYFKIALRGPPDTPYEGGVFHLELFLPLVWPTKALLIRFLTKIYHPNIDRLGRICVSILKDDWSPITSMQKVCLSIQLLMQSPNPADGLDPRIAEVFSTNPEKAKRRARRWTARYANRDIAEFK